MVDRRTEPRPITQLVRDRVGDYLVVVEELEESHDELLAALELLLDQETNMAGECGWFLESQTGR